MISSISFTSASTYTPQRSSGRELSSEEQQKVEELRERDREVRQHEEAHKAAAGEHVQSGPHYEYQNGPDGKRYAVGGEVKIDTSEIPDDPEATIRKAQKIKRAAMAPSEPSSQDRTVASEAERMEAKARAELAEKRQEKSEISGTTAEKPTTYSADGSKKSYESSVPLLDLIG